jgi:hypothetical protein
MEKFKYVIKSAIAGAVITLATGLVTSTPGQLLGAAWYGWPVTWIRKLVLAPQYNPWVVDWYGLAIDFVFWFIVSWLVIYIICALAQKKTPAKSMASKSSKSSAKRKKG